MPKIKISSSDKAKFEKAVRNQTMKVINGAMREMRDLLFKEATILADTIKQSNEFTALQTTLVGEFGFTPAEVAELDNILQLLIPGTDRQITNIEFKVSQNKSFAILNWVNFDKLKRHPLAQHDLTRFNNRSKSFELTETISWVEWLEEGATVRDYVFDPTGRGRSSRSGEGIMRRREGGLWTFEPTFIFQKTGNQFRGKRVRDGFGAIVKRRGKK